MKRIKPYLYTCLTIIFILSIIFIKKGIFPFGDNSLIWGDMHDQITAFYYHFYDSVYGNSSILIDFSTSGGINFLGILAYYILSPFTLLVLIVPRNLIYLMVSVIVAFKIIMCGITCMYFLRTYFKNMPSILYVLLSVIYAFSGYGIMMYQITPWIDAMYMFPLIVIGLKKVLDLEKPTMYIICLTLSLIFSFYVSVMVIIFIFLASLIYLYVYREKEERKKAILSLGIATVLSLLISAFVVVPAYLEISKSSRLGFNLHSLLNSKTGPISDKLAMISFGGIIYAGIILLCKNYKEHKKFLTFYIPTILILLIPLIIEPINKVWHFGSYAAFPYRMGFILMFLMVLGAAYFFNNYNVEKGTKSDLNKLLSLIITAITCFVIPFFINRYYSEFQYCIHKLSISFNHRLVIVLLATTLLSVVSSLLIILLNKKLTTYSLLLITIITLVHIISNSFIYLGIDSKQDSLTYQYKILTEISKDYEKGDYYRVKNNLSNMIANSGMVMKYHNYDHFTSLTDKNNLESMMKLGYGSYWVKIFSRGSNIFIDTVLANKYLLADDYDINPYYKLIDTYKNAKFYKLKNEIPFGYIIKENDTIFDKTNSFEIANSMYHNILDTEDDIFEYDNHFVLDNVKATFLEDDFIKYEIVDEDYYAYLEKNIIVSGKKNLYIDISRSLNVNKNILSGAFNIYINNHLYKEDAFKEPDNGVFDLGIYDNELVNIKLELKRGVEVKEIAIGEMDINKYNEFVKEAYIDTNINYNRNKIEVEVEGTKDKILFLPIAYNSNFKATNNNKDVEILKVYDNFIGIKLEDGVNNITITYIPHEFTCFLIISVIALIITIILISTKLYMKIINIEILGNIAYYVYLFLYLAFIVIVYILLTLCFLVSYFKVL